MFSQLHHTISQPRDAGTEKRHREEAEKYRGEAGERKEEMERHVEETRKHKAEAEFANALEAAITKAEAEGVGVMLSDAAACTRICTVEP